MHIELKTFLSAFFSNDDEIHIRVFSDRKTDDPDYKGNKYTEKLKNINSLTNLLRNQNRKHRGIFFVVNYGGDADTEITRINAQFAESDAITIKEQMQNLEQFSLPPSIIVRTRKSLHAYWIMKDARVDRFREIQLRLVEQFSGDKACQNESRVLRIPGFYHCKSEPVMVECIKFEPELKYTQDQLAEVLPEADIPAIDLAARSDFQGLVGEGQRILDKCAFMRYCRKHAAELSEPYWHCMITNMALAADGDKIVHELSKPYKGYSKKETDEKIHRAIKENKPHTCEFIRNRLGFKDCGDCHVKAPVVHAVLSMDEQAENLINGELTEDMIFADRTIELMSYAKKHQPALYGRFKLKLKGKCSIRDFEAAVNFKINHTEIIEDMAVPLKLDNIDLHGAVQPANWKVTMKHGIQRMISSANGNTVITICPSPVIISRRFESIDNSAEKVELSFYRDGRWKRIICLRSTAFNKSSLISCADRGLPVSSATSGELVAYLSDYENANMHNIPLMKSTERLGWINESSFFPYTAEADVCFETDMEDSNEIHRSLAEHGDYAVWLDYADRVRQNPYGRFMIAAAFASVLLEPLRHRVFFVNIWHDTTSGKSAAAKLAVSVWGDPLKLMGSFNATAVGLERKADTLCNIIYGLDERQLANEHRLPMAQIVYGLSNGFGRIRGSKDGGIQNMTNWRLIVLSTAEEPLLSDDSHDGMNTRVLELHGQPVQDRSFGAELHNICETHYGFAGRIFVKRLCEELKLNHGIIASDYKRIRDALKARLPVATHLDNAAVIALGDYYSDMWIWKANPDVAFSDAVKTAAEMLENNVSLEKEDIISRAWQYVSDWCVANDKAFGNDAPVKYGVKEDAVTYCVSKFALEEALQKKNYPVEKCMTGFFERGYMQKWNGKRQKQKRVNGVQKRYYVVQLGTIDEVTPLV